MFQRNHIKQNELLNKLLSNQGSVSEKTTIAKSLDNDHLQKAVPHSDYAKVEWERRTNEKQWFQKPLGIIALTAAGTVIASLAIYLLRDLIF